jgi:hypothetical protein
MNSALTYSGEGQGHRALEVLDRRDLFEDLGQAGDAGDGVVALLVRLGKALDPALVADQAVKALRLQGQQVGNTEWFVNLCE